MTACLINYSQLTIWQSVLSHFKSIMHLIGSLQSYSEAQLPEKMNQTFIYKRKGSSGWFFLKDKFTQKWKIVLSFTVLSIEKCPIAVKLHKHLKSTIKSAYMNHTPSLLKLYNRILWIKNWSKRKSLFMANVWLLFNVLQWRKTFYWTRQNLFRAKWWQNFFFFLGQEKKDKICIEIQQIEALKKRESLHYRDQ